jgi:PAS domain S-box-containing protein
VALRAVHISREMCRKRTGALVATAALVTGNCANVLLTQLVSRDWGAYTKPCLPLMAVKFAGHAQYCEASVAGLRQADLDSSPDRQWDVVVMTFANAVMNGSYDSGEVARSVLIAVAASYVALDLTGRITVARGGVRMAWLSGGATAMGVGIWAMHLKGMLAFRLPVPVEYDWPTLLAAGLIAVFVSAVGLYTASHTKMGWVEALTGTVFMSGSIVGLHYTGMAAMRLPAITQYSPSLVTASVLIAALFSLIALLLAFGLREETRWSVPRRLGSAIVMGAAVSAMHYTGMAAATFIPSATLPNLSHALNISPVGNNGIAIVTFLVLCAAIVTSSVDRRSEAATRFINERLEQSVDLRTKQLSATNESLLRQIAERLRVEDELRRNEDHLRLVIDTIPQQIWSGPPNGSLDFCNAQWRAYTGLALDELQGDGWQRMLHPEDRERVLVAWSASVTTGEPYEQEERHRRADGQYRCFLSRGIPLRDAEGLIVRWYGTNTDIQDRKEAEDRLRLVVDTTPALLHSARPDGYLDFFNKRWLDYVGLSMEDMSGWRWTGVIHPDDVEEEVGKWRSSLATGEPFEVESRVRRADGEYRWMLQRKVPARDDQGNIVKWYGSAVDIEDRKRAEQELRQAEEHIRAILEYSPNWIFLKDTEGRYLLVNREIERVFGISQEQIKGKTDSEIFPPEQAAEYRANDLKVLRAGLTMEFEEIALLEDGPHTSIVHKFPLFDTHGNIYATGGVATDITERKRAEEARRYSEEQYRTVVEAASDAVISIDENGDILLANPATTRIFGYEPVELIGKPMTVLMPDYMRNLHEAGRRRYLATGQRHLNWQGTELTALRKNGQEFPVELSFGEMFSNGHRVFTGFVRDISEKKRAEDELRKQKEVFQKIFENIPVMIVFFGADGRIELVNQEWEHTTGWTLEDIRKTNADMYAELFPDPQYRQTVRTMIASPTGQWADIKVRIRDGRVLEVAADLIHLSDGSSLGIGKDITEWRRTQVALQESDAALSRATRAVALGELTASIAHEINQPLTAVVTDVSASLRWLAQEPPNMEEARAALVVAIREANRAGDVIGRIRALLRHTPPPMLRLDIREIIVNVLGLARRELREQGIIVKVELADDTPPVLGDQVQLQQLLLNLIVNAIDAMSTINDRPRELTLRSAPHVEVVLIQVQDTGIGLDPARSDRIFEPFFTTKPEGIGMGLAISRSIVEAHGGWLAATPNSPYGSVFEFTLQRASDSDD